MSGQSTREILGNDYCWCNIDKVDKYTYNVKERAAGTKYECHCFMKGSFKLCKCKPGHYCDQDRMLVPLACPSGFYNDEAGATSIS